MKRICVLVNGKRRPFGLGRCCWSGRLKRFMLDAQIFFIDIFCWWWLINSLFCILLCRETPLGNSILASRYHLISDVGWGHLKCDWFPIGKTQRKSEFIFSQKHLWCLGSRLAVKTAWERYGVEESAERCGCRCEDVAVTLLLWGCYRARCCSEGVIVHTAGVKMLPWGCYRVRCCCEDVTVHAAGVRMLPCTVLVWGCCRCEDVTVHAAGVRMLPVWRCCRARCWCEDAAVKMLPWTREDVTVHAAGVRMCEDVAARYRAADGAGVRMLLRDTVLRTVRTVLVWGCCCAIPCCGRCGRCWCEDGAARYRAADGADGAGVRMVLRDTVLRTVRTVHAAGVRMCEDVAARYRAADGTDGAGVRMLLRDTVLRTVRTVLVWGCCCAIPCCGLCGRCWCEDGAARYRAADGADSAGVRMLLRCGRCGRCWCEDVAARYRAADGADGAGVRMLLRETVLRTVRTVLVWGCCCAIPCCGRCGRCWCEDGAARYRAADGADGAVRTVLVWGWCCAIPCCGRCGRCTLLVWGCVRMLLRDTVLRTVRTVLVWGCCCTIPCCGRCGRCWCEDVAARYGAADGADGAGVRMVLRDTVLRTVRTVLVCRWCCAIPCCGRCGRCWCMDVAARYRAADDGVGVRMCEDVAARYRAADGAVGAGVRMLLRDTVLRTVRTVLVWGWCCAIPCCGRCGRCWCEDGAARYRAADSVGVRMLLRDTVLRTVLVWGCCCAIPWCCCAIPCYGRCGRCWCEDVAARYRAADGADGAC